MGLPEAIRSDDELHGVPGKWAGEQRLASHLARELPRATEACPVCAGFCADCRIRFMVGEPVRWWRVLPFHPQCGTSDPMVYEVTAGWSPPYRCRVWICTPKTMPGGTVSGGGLGADR